MPAEQAVHGSHNGVFFVSSRLGDAENDGRETAVGYQESNNPRNRSSEIHHDRGAISMTDRRHRDKRTSGRPRARAGSV